VAQREFRQIYPQPGWVEHDPREIWSSQLATAREALAKAGLGAADIAGIGITNQRETTIVWNRASGEPIGNAIVWQDRRTAPACDALKAARPRAALSASAPASSSTPTSPAPSSPGCSTTSTARAPRRSRRARLRHGRHLADVASHRRRVGSDAIGGDPRDRPEQRVADAALRRAARRLERRAARALDVPREVLPEVEPSSHVFGHTTADLFGAPIAIGGVAGDQQSALFGQACFRPGQVKNTYGTGCFMLMNTGDRFEVSAHGLIATSAAQPTTTAQFAREGSVFIGGAVVQWLRDGLKAIKASSEVQQLAASVPDSGGVMFVPAFTGLGAPHWNPDARGTIVGLTRGSTIAHIARAALESIAFQSAALLEAMSRDVVAGGGAPVSSFASTAARRSTTC
jgi:glycerol kinase